MNEEFDEYFNQIARVIRRLPPAASIFFREISWKDGEALSQAVQALRRVRIAYDAGLLEITATCFAQERIIKILDGFIFVLLTELKQPIEGFGSATLKTSSKSIDPDSSYYIQNAHLVIGKEVDFDLLPPPDLVFEVVLYSPSLEKFPIYSAIGVPEIWKYQNDHVEFYHLVEGRYQERRHSLAFSFLTSDVISEFIPIGKSRGQSAAIQSFANWLKAHKPTA
jgi:Uma2 family endonuclease